MVTWKHIKRRAFLSVFPIALAIFVALRVTINMEIKDFYEILKVVIGVWATLLGFIITAASILITFNGSKLTEEIKNTGHFKTVLFIYMLTCIKLLIGLMFFIAVICLKIYSPLILQIFVASIITSMVDILLCLIFLSFVIYTIFR